MQRCHRCDPGSNPGRCILIILYPFLFRNQKSGGSQNHSPGPMTDALNFLTLAQRPIHPLCSFPKQPHSHSKMPLQPFAPSPSFVVFGGRSTFWGTTFIQAKVSEVNGLARNIRLGELFLKLIDALNTVEQTMSCESMILVKEPRIQSLDELKEFNIGHSSSHSEKGCVQILCEISNKPINHKKECLVLVSLNIRTKNFAFGEIWTHASEDIRTWVGRLRPLGHECQMKCRVHSYICSFSRDVTSRSSIVWWWEVCTVLYLPVGARICATLSGSVQECHRCAEGTCYCHCRRTESAWCLAWLYCEDMVSQCSAQEEPGGEEW